MAMILPTRGHLAFLQNAEMPAFCRHWTCGKYLDAPGLARDKTYKEIYYNRVGLEFLIFYLFEIYHIFLYATKVTKMQNSENSAFSSLVIQPPPEAN